MNTICARATLLLRKYCPREVTGLRLDKLLERTATAYLRFTCHAPATS
jgi:hypothetical protein